MFRFSDDEISIFITRMIRIVEIDIKRIVEDSLGFIKRNPVFRQISFCFFFIPLKIHDCHLTVQVRSSKSRLWHSD